MIGTVRIEGGDEFQRALEAKINAAIGSFNGTVIDIVPSGKRGQAANTVIGNVLKSQERNPFYLDAQAKDAIRFAMRGLMAAQYSVRQRAVEIVGEVMKLSVARNLDAQKNPGGGAFRPLTTVYAAFKQRRFGYIVPIGRATGDLMDNLRARITKVR